MTERVPLNRTNILAAAIEIAATDGVAKLSMRHLARSLGYEVMSLYNHIANKDELLAAMVDAVAAEVTEPTETAPMAAIRTMAMSTHDMFLRHPWITDLWLRCLPGPNRIRSMEDLLRLLAESGLRPDLAHFGFHAVNNHVVGHAMQHLEMTFALETPETTMRDFVAQLDEADHPHTLQHLQQHIDGEEGGSFELALDLILDGLERMNDESHRAES